MIRQGIKNILTDSRKVMILYVANDIIFIQVMPYLIVFDILRYIVKRQQKRAKGTIEKGIIRTNSYCV